jgi:hypothetical protein
LRGLASNQVALQAWREVEIMLAVHRPLVGYLCNPSCSGSRDQENQSLKPAWAEFKHSTEKEKLLELKDKVEQKYLQYILYKSSSIQSKNESK